MFVKQSITDEINRLCNQLDTNPFLGKEERHNIQEKITELVERRQRLIDAYAPRKEEVNVDP